MKKLMVSTAMVAALACGAALAQAQMQTPERGTSNAPLTDTQRVTTGEFLDQAWNINNFEIQAGKQAESKATDPAYKNYAQMIVDDHTKMSNDLRSLTEQMRNAEMPTKLDSAHQQKLQQLTSASGSAFEQQFKTQQIEGHEQAIRLFQSYAANGDNAQLKSWAQSSVAILQRHFDQAHNLPRPAGIM